MQRISGIQVIEGGQFGGAKKGIATIPIAGLLANGQDKITATLFVRVVGATTIGFKLGSTDLEQSLSSSDDTGQAKVTLDLVRDGSDVICMIDQSTGGPAYESTPSGPLSEQRIAYDAQTQLVITGLGASENIGIVVDVDAYSNPAA